MIAFKIILNGEKLALAGVGADGVLTSIVSWGSKDTGRKGSANLHVGGIESPAVHVNWIDKDLEVGDSVEVRIVEQQDVDEPQMRKATPRPDKNAEKDFKVVK